MELSPSNSTLSLQVTQRPHFDEQDRDLTSSGLDWRTEDSTKSRNWYACLLVKEHYVVGFQRVHEFAIFDDEVLANTYSWMSTVLIQKV
jgi:hypothetical protein